MRIFGQLFVDPEHKFDLAIQLGDLETGYSLATESASEQKWKQLAELATNQAKFDLAQQCLHEAQVRYTKQISLRRTMVMCSLFFTI